MARFESEALGVESCCILAAACGNETEAALPHLVALSSLAADGDAWDSLLTYASSHSAALTLLASPLGFESLLSHLEAFSEIVLPDDTEMFFAYWDPAVLGTLLGQASDKTLHVPSPVLTERQRAAFLRGIACWWYWDRDGGGQRGATGPPVRSVALPAPPLKLFQVQVEMLVETGVPD